MKHLKLVKGYKEKLLDTGIIVVMTVPTKEQSKLPSDDYDREFAGRDPGIYITLLPSYYGVKQIVLPRDGDSVYVTNEKNGKTIESYHWPIRSKPVATSEPNRKVG